MTDRLLRSRRAELDADRRARSLRKIVASELIHTFAEGTPPDCRLGHFEKEFVRFGARSTIWFNAQVTDRVLRDHVLPLTDPAEILRVGAKVTEQNFYIIQQPQNAAAPRQNLAVSKRFGTFFTPLDIAQEVADSVLDRGSNGTLLDPCAGSGILLGAGLLQSPNAYSRIIGVELDPWLAQWSELLLRRVANLVGFAGDLRVISGDGLEHLHRLIQSDAEPESDIVINPPYGRIRVTRDSFTNKETRMANSDINEHVSKARSRIDEVRTLLRSKYPTLVESRGVLEWSKLFMTACGQLASRGVTCGVISPDSWMSGRDALPLRRYLIENRLLYGVRLIPEDAKRFKTVNQALSITTIGKASGPSFKVQEETDVFELTFERVLGATDYALPRTAGALSMLLQRVETGPRFGDVEWITNARGEVDLTLQKHLISSTPTSQILMRGEHIIPFRTEHFSRGDKAGYLKEAEFQSFIQSKPKFDHFLSERIVGRQCSYAKQRRRLIFARIPARQAVANSCNYLVIGGEDDQRAARTHLLLGILNSAVLDWYFRSRNSNNHVANYELDQLPFPSDDRWFDLIAWAAAQLEKGGSRKYPLPWLRTLLEAATGLAFELDPITELKSIIERIGGLDPEPVVRLARHLARFPKVDVPNVRSDFFNHQPPTLSALDEQIISYVPEGGNWQNIPESVPSQRLRQIRQMTAERGVVRTTYYGRLRRDQPAYTINTYFNRPGNGTHIHPILDRTLTAREAARLQSFPDEYIFSGAEGAVRKQIGNAVPPLLAEAIGRQLGSQTESHLCVDAFCGAGGLSLGLESAGWEIIAAIDNDQAALNTYALNRPALQTPTMNFDLAEGSSLELASTEIASLLIGRQLDLLVGGPPCQGFSHAGFRNELDRRNDLATAYLRMAEILRPRIVLLENVEGLASYRGGLVLRDLCWSLRDIGYFVREPVWKLYSEEYGVPQMRRRIFIVASLESSIDLEPPKATHLRCFGRWRDRKPTDFDITGELIPAVTVAEALAGLSLPCDQN